MIGLITVDWLTAFYKHIDSNSWVLLLMDNFSAHLTGIGMAPPSSIRIQMLLENSTSIFQPLDQGITQGFKVFYRRQWLKFIIEQFDRRADPLSSVTLYHTIRWSVGAWMFDVTNSTICNCFCDPFGSCHLDKLKGVNQSR